MRFFTLLAFLCLFSSCYSFRGISIPPEVLTFSVEDFDDRSLEQVPGLAPDFTQALKDRIRNESRLEEVPNGEVADIEFSGFISRFETVSLAPQPDATTALSQLKIYIKIAVQYKEEKFIEDEFDQTFNFGLEYPADQNLLDLQDDLIPQIFDQITTDVFNKAFTNW